jgi:predicted CXXCH cytochrome family protein
MLIIPSYNYGQDSGDHSFEDVHSWPGSQCEICHMTSDPQDENAALVIADRSRLCESCHKGTVTILPVLKLQSRVDKMDNHPIKFSPLDFEVEKINHDIVKEGKYFYVSGRKNRVPLFGETIETSVAECTTCHDPHGKEGISKLLRVNDSDGQLCLVCHVSF